MEDEILAFGVVVRFFFCLSLVFYCPSLLGTYIYVLFYDDDDDAYLYCCIPWI